MIKQEGTVITDNGSEYKGDFAVMLQQPGLLWKRLIAQVDIVQSNSMVEAANKIIKNDYFINWLIEDTETLLRLIPIMLEDYNNRPQGFLFGLSCNEVLDGVMPDKHLFANSIQQAKNIRFKTNRNGGCIC